MESPGEIVTVLGDRVLVEVLQRTEKSGGLYVPQSYAEQQRGHKALWFGRVVAFGLDSKAEDTHSLKAGDVVGLDPIGRDCAGFRTEDGREYAWVPDEFLAAKETEDEIRRSYGFC